MANREPLVTHMSVNSEVWCGPHITQRYLLHAGEEPTHPTPPPTEPEAPTPDPKPQPERPPLTDPEPVLPPAGDPPPDPGEAPVVVQA